MYCAAAANSLVMFSFTETRRLVLGLERGKSIVISSVLWPVAICAM